MAYSLRRLKLWNIKYISIKNYLIFFYFYLDFCSSIIFYKYYLSFLFKLYLRNSCINLFLNINLLLKNFDIYNIYLYNCFYIFNFFFINFNKFFINNIRWFGCFNLLNVAADKRSVAFNSINFSFYYINSFIRFCEYLFGLKICLKIYTNLFFNTNLFYFFYFLNIVTKCKYAARAFKMLKLSFLTFLKVLLILYFSFFLHDIRGLGWLFKILFLSCNLFRHARLFYELTLLIKNYFFKYFKLFKLAGVKFMLRGKVNVAGNRRKRFLRAAFGYTSRSAYFLKVKYSYQQIWTSTGALGLHLWFFYF